MTKFKVLIFGAPLFCIIFGFIIWYLNIPDLILENASIYDGLSDKSFIGSIGVKDSKISFINKGKITAYDECGGTRVINLKEYFIYPGFVDGHGHLKGIGYRELTLNLQGIPSLDLTVTNSTPSFFSLEICFM